MATIDPMTVIPIHLEPLLGGTKMADATGYVVERGGNTFVITNWHVVTGRHPDTGQPLDQTTGVADPQEIRMWLHDKTTLGTWRSHVARLRDGAGTRLWHEHAAGREVDVVALRIAVPPDSRVFSLDLASASIDMVLSPSEPVSIVGFPLGLVVAGKFPIWKTGHIASDLDLNYLDRPIFLIDATTKPAMSGSPVVAARFGVLRSSTGINLGASGMRFLGTYSGRINENIDASIGFVWKPIVIDQIFATAGL